MELGLRKCAARWTIEGCHTPCSLIDLETEPSIGSIIMSKPYFVETTSYLSERENLFVGVHEVETY